MVNSCSANGCKNRNTKGGTLTFHRFPLNNKHLLKLWLYQIKRGTWEPSKYSVICSEHFTEDSFVIKGQNNRRTLKNDAYPTVFSVANYTEPPKKKKSPKERNQMDVDVDNNVKEGNNGEASEKNSESSTSKPGESSPVASQDMHDELK